MQLAIVIVIVSLCGAWLLYQGWRYFRPRANGKLCAGGCCDGGVKKPATVTPHVMMISSDDLRARIRARKS
ncbi:MAG TPA: hypothetical protein VHM90_01340 [Phycisphaerae bacterium]|nr:hypothetical protein [Phycisphaerae bacterium]